jgi:hypothetical protein
MSPSYVPRSLAERKAESAVGARKTESACGAIKQEKKMKHEMNRPFHSEGKAKSATGTACGGMKKQFSISVVIMGLCLLFAVCEASVGSSAVQDNGGVPDNGDKLPVTPPKFVYSGIMDDKTLELSLDTVAPASSLSDIKRSVNPTGQSQNFTFTLRYNGATVSGTAALNGGYQLTFTSSDGSFAAIISSDGISITISSPISVGGSTIVIGITLTGTGTTSIDTGGAPASGTILYTVAGTVSTDSGGLLSGALVRLLNSSQALVAWGATGTNGAYRLSAPAGTYTVNASAPGYDESESASFTVSGNVSGKDLTLIANPTGYTVSGTISDTSGPLSGASVQLKQDANTKDTTTTAEDGTYTFSGITSGIYTINASAPGYDESESAAFELSTNVSGKNLTLTAIPTGYTVSGIISDSSGFLSGASVQLKQDASTKDTTTTASNGSYAFSGVISGTYTIEVSKSGYNTGTSGAFMVSGDVSGENLTLTASAGGGAGINVSFTEPEDETVTLTGPAYTPSWSANTAITITLAESFDSYQWFLDSTTPLAGITNTLTLYAASYTPGSHIVSVKVMKGANPYTKWLIFTITQ